jgi:hypothetical protein
MMRVKLSNPPRVHYSGAGLADVEDDGIVYNITVGGVEYPVLVKAYKHLYSLYTHEPYGYYYECSTGQVKFHYEKYGPDWELSTEDREILQKRLKEGLLQPMGIMKMFEELRNTICQLEALKEEREKAKHTNNVIHINQ